MLVPSILDLFKHVFSIYLNIISRIVKLWKSVSCFPSFDLLFRCENLGSILVCRNLTRSLSATFVSAFSWLVLIESFFIIIVLFVLASNKNPGGWCPSHLLDKTKGWHYYNTVDMHSVHSPGFRGCNNF